jgi:hypothetical protein
MNPRLRNTGILALICVIVVPIILAVLGSDGAVIVLSIIATIGLFTVIFVSVFGSLENEAHPQSARDSLAVEQWHRRLGEDLKLAEPVEAHPQEVSDSKAAQEMQERAEADPAVSESSDTSS